MFTGITYVPLPALTLPFTNDISEPLRLASAAKNIWPALPPMLPEVNPLGKLMTGVGPGVGVGDAVGAGVGDAVGAGVGDAVGVGVGDGVGAGVGDAVGVEVGVGVPPIV